MEATLKTAVAFNVAFGKEVLDAKTARAVMALKTTHDDFHVKGREVYWLSRKKQSESKISNAVIEVTVGRPSTLRGISTIRQLATKYGPR